MDENGERIKKPPFFPPNYVTLAQLKEKWLLKKEQEKKLKEEEELEKEKQNQIQEIENQNRMQIEKQNRKEVQKQNQNQSWCPPDYVTLAQLKEKWLLKKEQEKKLKEEEEEEEKLKQNQDQNQSGVENEGKMIEQNGVGVQIGVDKGKEKQLGIGDDRMQGRNGYTVERTIAKDRLKVGILVGNSSSNGRIESESGLSVRFRRNGDDPVGRNASMEYRDRMDGGVNGGEEMLNGKVDGEKRKGNKWKGKRRKGRKGGDRSEGYMSGGNAVEKSSGKVGESEVLEVKDGVVEEGLDDNNVGVDRKTEGESQEAGKRNGGRKGKTRDRFRRSNRGENPGRNFGGVRTEMNVGHNESKNYSSNGNGEEQSRGKMSESESLEVGVTLGDGLEMTGRIPGEGLNDHCLQEKSLEVDRVKYGEKGERRYGFRRNGRNYPVRRKFGGVRLGNEKLWREKNVVGYRSSAGSGSKAEIHEDEGDSEKVEQSEIGVSLGCLVVKDIVQEAELNVNNIAVEDKNIAEISEAQMAKVEVRNGRDRFRRHWHKGENARIKFGHSRFGGSRSGNVRLRTETNVVSMKSASSGSKAEVHDFEGKEAEQNFEQVQGGEALEVGVKSVDLKVTANVPGDGLNENIIVVENENNAGSSKAHMAKDSEEGEGRNEFKRNWNRGGNLGRKFGSSGFGRWKSGNARSRTEANVVGSMDSAISGNKAEVQEGKNSEKVTESKLSEVGAKLDNLVVMDNTQGAEFDENNMVVENKNKAESSEVDRAKDDKKGGARDDDKEGEGRNEFRRNLNKGGNVGRKFGGSRFGGWRSSNVRSRTEATVIGSINSASSGSKAEVHDFKRDEEEEDLGNVKESEISEVGAKRDNLEVMDNVQEAELDENNMAMENKNKAESSEVDRVKDDKKWGGRDDEFRRNYWNRGGNVRRNFGRPAFGGSRSAFGYRNSASTCRYGALQMNQSYSRVVWVKKEEKPCGANDAESGSSGIH